MEPMEFLTTSIGSQAYNHELVRSWPIPLLSLQPGEMEDPEQSIRDLMEVTG